jgi:hypothetical protein
MKINFLVGRPYHIGFRGMRRDEREGVGDRYIAIQLLDVILVNAKSHGHMYRCIFNFGLIILCPLNYYYICTYTFKF